MKKRDRRLIPTNTSLVAGWPDAVPESTEVKPDTASAFYLDGEGTSKVKTGDTARIISKQISKTKKDQLKERRKKAKNNYRVPVLNPDGTPAMPTTNQRANKWLKEKKAKIMKNKLGIFQVQLIKEPSGRKKQPIVMTIDPGSAFTGIGVISKNAVLYGCTLELPGYKQGSKPNIVVNRFGKKIEKYSNSIIDGMDKRRELRRSRRHRNCRRREERWLNRSKSKIPPSILSRKQLELKVATELSKIYPIYAIGFEDISFNHFKDIEGIKGQFFSHVEVGKNWIIDRLRKLVPKGNFRVIRGYDTARMRTYLNMKKEVDKTVRSVDSHVNDCIAMGAILFGFKLGIETNANNQSTKVDRFNKFKFDTITRPKYSRRMLHLEQSSRGGVRRRYGGTTIPWSNIRKGDYVEATLDKKDKKNNKMLYRCWISGYTNMNGQNYLYISDFDWKGFGKNKTQTATIPSNVRLLDRNHGLLIRSMEMIEERINICKYGTIQKGVDGGKMVKIEKEKVRKEEIINDKTKQLGIENAWR